MTELELYHYGVKGMKWGVRRAVKSLTNHRNLLNKDGYKNTDNRKPAGTLTDGYKKSPKPATVTSLRQASKKARADGLAARKAARDSGQLKGIGAVRKGNKIQRDATKASLKKLQNIKIKDLEKRYGELEDSMEYGKKADSNNRKIQAEMDRVENEIRRLKKTNK